MRGKVPDIPPTHDENRITPAYAGKSCSTMHTIHRKEDHPRLCGEKVLRFDLRTENLGSPPPMRGKAVNGHVTFLHIGITPAYAGKSSVFIFVIPP